MTAVTKYLKAHIALVGSLLAWYLATYPTGTGVRYVSVGVVILTALGVAVVPNKDLDADLDHAFPDPARRADAGYGAIELLVGLIVVIIAILLLVDVLLPAITGHHH